MNITLTPVAEKALVNYLKKFEDRMLTGYRNSYTESELAAAAGDALHRILESAPDETGYAATWKRLSGSRHREC